MATNDPNLKSALHFLCELRAVLDMGALTLGAPETALLGACALEVWMDEQRGVHRPAVVDPLSVLKSAEGSARPVVDGDW